MHSVLAAPCCGVLAAFSAVPLPATGNRHRSYWPKPCSQLVNLWALFAACCTGWFAIAAATAVVSAGILNLNH
jgi:hypothetical protein